MTTKNDNIGNDCYNKAFDDEELFTLRAKDPGMRDVIRLWVADRLLRAFERGELTLDSKAYQAKLEEALSCADSARRWWRANPDRRNNNIGSTEE